MSSSSSNSLFITLFLIHGLILSHYTVYLVKASEIDSGGSSSSTSSDHIVLPRKLAMQVMVGIREPPAIPRSPDPNYPSHNGFPMHKPQPRLAALPSDS
ncbi:hypothetical protein OWV82_007661 [Melia azedarach]|uniref:Uncharacterized protein n=1 Tax=Melia azedarach TaxID=155640 RepID=A0ACC1Y7M9_MELAZ|nr:hypothetical protein OWV82_007661 [Melia azedarach]